ncbi:MAG: IMP cyclohydrolase [Candidatus Sumerlaeia bacterium]
MQEAIKNLEELGKNPYPGRGIIIGMGEKGESLIQVYWIMGRSPNSRNRVFEKDGALLRTAAADPSKVQDPSLIIYNAMREMNGLYVVTNGDQTDTIIQGILTGTTFCQALNTRAYEPDAPNFTPRISGICSLKDGLPWAELSVLKKSVFGAHTDRHCFRYEEFGPGLGHCITTYMGDGDPLPSFSGEPRLMPLEGSISELANNIWNHLNEDNRVSLAVKFIDIETGGSNLHVINKYSKVG